MKPPPTVPSLPQEWKEVFDSVSGRMYYFNEVTRITQWHLPQIDDSWHLSPMINRVTADAGHPPRPQAASGAGRPSSNLQREYERLNHSHRRSSASITDGYSSGDSAESLGSSDGGGHRKRHHRSGFKARPATSLADVPINDVIDLRWKRSMLSDGTPKN